MKQQILVIPGGWAHDDEQGYLDYLSSKQVHINQDPSWMLKNWRAQLVWHLGDGYEVTVPVMPSKDNAKYEQWKLWFERYFEHIDGDVILIGESLGGTFLVKYLSENNVPFNITSLILVAAGFDDGNGYSFGDFVIDKELSKTVSDKIERLGLFYSDNDPYSLLAEVDKMSQLSDNCHTEVLHNRGHFSVAVIPELVTYVRELCEK